MISPLETIEVEHSSSGCAADAAVIWLHGLGADGHDFEAIVPQLNLPASLSIRFIFPHAPIRPVTINGGYEMRSWYDILATSELREIDEQQLEESRQQLIALIENEITRGIKSERIVVAGFSQGGAVSLSMVPRFEKPLAGMMALSTYLPIANKVAAEKLSANAAIPIFMGHGTQDPVVTHSLGLTTRQQLQDMGYQPQWHEYEMQHSVCMEEVIDISVWLQQVLGV